MWRCVPMKSMIFIQSGAGIRTHVVINFFFPTSWSSGKSHCTPLALKVFLLNILNIWKFSFIQATCGITRFGVGVSYAFCFAVLLVKLMVILTSKTSDVLFTGELESPNYLKGIYQFLLFIFAVGVQVYFCGFFYIKE